MNDPLPDLKMACDIFPRSSSSLFYFFDIMILNALMMMILMIPRCASRQQLGCAQVRARHKRMSGFEIFFLSKSMYEIRLNFGNLIEIETDHFLSVTNLVNEQTYRQISTFFICS